MIDNKSQFQGESLRKQASTASGGNNGSADKGESVLEKISDIDTSDMDPFKKNRTAKLSTSSKKP
ncbi:MAG: hypothetical protein GKR95_12060 [Gammaproteobacteria bacterium]|nr:hypothetical protein [Gammaproteobacteria bacterium]NKB61107.1 hypothetical protein [Gammaproteobacteria bacterium]NKB62811.1 hypothetical protein [Gammaproteobacteria bacterium]